MKKIVWAPSAIKDLKEVHEFIARDSLGEATKFCDGVTLKVEQLANFPEMGRKIPEIGESRYSEIIIGDYRIFHEVRIECLIIFRLMHSRRQPEF